MGQFTGVWGVFENLDEMTQTIKDVRAKGFHPTTLSPSPRHEIEHALGKQFTLVPWIALVFGILSIPTYVRIARASTLGVASREFVQAAEAIGTKRFWILFREIIPNILPSLFAYALINAGFVIVVEGTLSYLGLSVQIPEPTWGNMINEGRRDIRQTILPIFWPGLFLTLTVVSLNMLGDWFQQRVAIRSSAL